MPIDKSHPWGEVVSLTTDVPVFRSEAELSFVLSPSGPSEARMSGGDFVEVTGGTSANDREVRRYVSDVLEVRADDLSWWTVGTVEARSRRWRMLGGFVVASNLGQRAGERYSTRTHPNDGKFEVVDALDGLSTRERLTLIRRLATGGDISHPRVRQRQIDTYHAPRPLHLFVDGHYRGRHSVTITLHPDALVVYV